MHKLALFAAMTGLAFATGPAFADTLAAAGQVLYAQRCSGCHSIDQNVVGPRHRGVVGRKAGSVADYAYSPALKQSGIVWTEANLDMWLQGPSTMVPGTRMAFNDQNANERAAIIAYLKTQK